MPDCLALNDGSGDRLDCFARMTRAGDRLTFTLILPADRGDVPFLDRNAPNIYKQKSFFHRIPFAKSTVFTLRSPSPRKEIFSRRRRLRAKQQHTFIPLPSHGTTDFDASVFYKNFITVAVPNFSFTYLTKQPGAAAVIFLEKNFPYSCSDSSMDFLTRTIGRMPSTSRPKRPTVETVPLPRLLPRHITHTVSGREVCAVSV